MTDDRFLFWRRFLLVWFGTQVVMGWSVILLIDTSVWQWHQERVAEALWGRSDLGPEAKAYRAWVMGLFGPTLAAWATAALFIVAVPFKRREPWAWWALVASVAAWAPFDTAVSISHGVWVNVMFNLVAVVVMAIPLAATWSVFRSSPETTEGRGSKPPSPDDVFA